jgi:hypothetical protein
MSGNFLITGMFRSGTTMLARMMHSNPNVVCASDPFAPIFKSYRNVVAKTIEDKFDENSPLNDYYFDKMQNNIFREIQKKDFNIAVPKDELSALRGRIREHCKPYSPKIIPNLHMLKGSTYVELLDSAVEIIRKSYKKTGENLIGYKEVWVDEMSMHFIKMKKGNKVIHLVRDPRSIVASNFSSGATYPLLFLIRQWRKLASIAWMNEKNNKNIIFIKFEDLILNPKEVAMRICEFLNIEYHVNMIDPNRYKDGNDDFWVQNSSHDDNNLKGVRQKFNKQSLDKWKSVLSDEVISLIEIFCSYEMKLFGYHNSKKFDINQSGLLLDYKDNTSLYSEWIKLYAPYDNSKEIAVELTRYLLLKSNVFLSKDTEKLFLLNSRIRPYFCKK